MDWSSLYPKFFSSQKEKENDKNLNQKMIEFADIGCGYGGLLGEYHSTLEAIIN